MADCERKMENGKIVERHFEQACQIAGEFHRLERERVCQGLDLEELESEAYLSLPEIAAEWTKSEPFGDYLKAALTKKLRSRSDKLTENRRKHRQETAKDEYEFAENAQRPEDQVSFWDSMESRLTPEENEIVHLMHEGITSKSAIAEATGLNWRTVAARMEAIQEKLTPIYDELRESSGRP